MKGPVYKYLVYAALFLVLVCSFTISNPGVPANNTVSSKDPLVVYGEYVYRKEACANCHTQLSDDNSGLISLDGLGGRFTDNWHYYHLQDPASMKMGSDMPAFAFLSDRNMNRQVFDGLMRSLGGDSSANSLDLLWNKAVLRSDSMAAHIMPLAGPVLKGTEMIALIAYLQQIPASPLKMKSDSVVISHEREEQQAWNDLSNDSSSVLMLAAMSKDAKTIAEGKQLYLNNCTPCHGEAGQGRIGPNLADEYWLHGRSAKNVSMSIAYGIPDKGMRAWKYDLAPEEVGQLVAYIFSLQGTNPPDAKAPQGKKE